MIIVNYRTAQLTMGAVHALRAERDLLPRLRVTVVDGGSGDDSARELAAFAARPECREWVSFLPLALNGGFGWANNQAILMIAREPQPPEFVHVLNPDTEVTPGAVVRLVQELERHDRCGAAGSQLLAPDGRPTPSAFRFPTPARELIAGAQSERLAAMLGIDGAIVAAEQSREADWVTGASVMFRAQALRDSGLFDDGFFLYFEEVELMHRMTRSGWSVRHVPDSRVVHVEGASTGFAPARKAANLPPYWYRSRRRYFGLTGGRLKALTANAGLLAGDALAAGKALAGGSPAERRWSKGDLLKLGFWPGKADTRPSFPAWGDTPGPPPAWMARS